MVNNPTAIGDKNQRWVATILESWVQIAILCKCIHISRCSCGHFTWKFRHVFINVGWYPNDETCARTSSDRGRWDTLCFSSGAGALALKMIGIPGMRQEWIIVGGYWWNAHALIQSLKSTFAVRFTRGEYWWRPSNVVIQFHVSGSALSIWNVNPWEWKKSS